MKRLLFFIALNSFLIATMGFGASSNNPTISITASASENEGNSGHTALTLTVTASDCPNKQDIIIDWETSGDSATAGEDFQTSSGTVTFKKSFFCNKSQNITVDINGDTDIEPDETFYVTLSDGGTNASQSYTWGNRNSTLTIVNDDGTPPIMGDVPDQIATNGSAFLLHISDYVTKTEGDSITSYTLTGTLPAGLSFDSSTGIISGTPTVDEIQNLSVIATDKDGDSNSDSFTLTVTSTQLPPVMGDVPDANIGKDMAYSLDISSYVTLTNNDPILSYTLTGTLPTGLNFNTTTGILSGTPTVAGTYNLNVTATDDDGESNSDLFTLTVMTVHTNADDLCYENITYEGMFCIDFGFFKGGIGCTQTIPIRNQGTDQLTNINITLDETGISGDFLGDCGIDEESGLNLTCLKLANINMGPMGMFGQGIIYDPVPDYDENDTHSIYTTSLMSMAIFSGENLYGAYIKNEEMYYGKISACNVAPTLTYNPGVVDAIDIYAQTATTPFYDAIIKTKIAGQTSVTLDAVYLGTDMTADAVYDAADMPVLMSIYYPALGRITKLYEADGVTPLAAVIAEGSISGTTPPFTIPASAAKEAYILMKYIDYQALLTDGGPNCLRHSSTGANAVPGLPSCVSSDVQYLDAFHQEAFDRCKVSNGEPCEPSHHGFSGGGDPTYPGYNPIYDHKYGCYECTLGATPQVRSVDNFAIRPKDFNLNIPSSDSPNLLRAGQDYNISLTARDYNDTISSDYNITDHNWAVDLDANTTKYFKDDTIDTAGLLHGSAEVNTSVAAYNLGGLSSDSNTSVPSLAEAVIPVSYDDVGKVNLQLYDTVWSAVDNDDTPMDCNDSHAHTYVCGDKNVTFIPHHFRFADLNITNHGGPNHTFTYIANERNLMSAKIQTHMKAENRDGNITQNFREGPLYYENNISVIPTVEIPGSGQTNGYFYSDANESNISNQMIGFGRAGFNEENGTRKILWNEPTYPLEYNFQRDRNRPGNPFIVSGSNLYILMVSHYIDPADGDTADINGSRAGDFNTTIYTNCGMDSNCQQLNAEGNATFYYGRVRPSQFFYPDVTTESINTPVAINIYCNLGFTQCGGFGINTVDAQISEFDWWLALDHNTSANDGNVTLVKHNPLYEGGSGDWDVNPKLLSIQPDGVNNGIDNSIIVSRGTNPTLPLTVGIDLDTATDLTTGKWLIYNPDSSVLDPIPFYKVRFVGQSGWAGYGDTGHVVETNSSTKKNKRLGW